MGVHETDVNGQTVGLCLRMADFVITNNYDGVITQDLSDLVKYKAIWRLDRASHSPH